MAISSEKEREEVGERGGEKDNERGVTAEGGGKKGMSERANKEKWMKRKDENSFIKHI